MGKRKRKVPIPLPSESVSEPNNNNQSKKIESHELDQLSVATVTPKLELADKNKQDSDSGKRKAVESESKPGNSLVNQDSVGVGAEVDGCTREILSNKSSEDVPSKIKKKKKKKKRRSSPENEVTLENEINDLPNSVISNCSDHRSNEKICTSIAAEVGHKVDDDSTHQNLEIPIKKKRSSGQGKKLALESGEPKAVVNNTSHQILNEEKANLSDGKISTAKVSHEEKSDLLDGNISPAQVANKSLVATSITADTHGKTSTTDVIIAAVNSEVDGCIQEDLPNKSSEDVPSEIKKKKKKKKRRSSQKNELTLENGINCSDQQPDERIDEVAEVKVDNYSTHQNPEIPIKKKGRSGQGSGQGKKLTLESGEPKALAGQNLNEEKSNMSDGKISTSLLTAKVSYKGKSDLWDGSTAQVITQVSDKVAWDTCELQNQDSPVNMCSVVTSRIADTHEEVNMVHSDSKRKRRSDQRKKLAVESGAPKALVNNSLDQNLKEEKSNLSDEKISLVAADVSRKADADTCVLQNQDPSVNKNSEAAFRTAAEHGEVHMVQSETKKKRRSHGKKLVLASGENKLPNTLVNDHSDQSLVEEKLNLLDGKLSIAQLAAEVSHKVDCGTCELQNEEALVSKGSETAPKTADGHGEVHMVQSEVRKRKRSGQGKKLVLASGANTMPNSLIYNNSGQNLIKEKSDLLDGSTAQVKIPVSDTPRTADTHEVNMAHSDIKKKRRSDKGKKLALESGAPKFLVNNSLDQNLKEEHMTDLVAAEVSHKADADTCELRNQEPSVNDNSEAASKAEHREVHMVQSKIMKKRRKKLGLASAENKTSDQNLNEEKSNLPDGKCSTSLIKDKVSPKADADTFELQNEEAPVSKGSEAASRTADEHGEMHMVQSEVKKKRRSGQGKEHVLASGAVKMPNSLVNYDSDQNVIKEKSDLLDGIFSPAQVATSFSDKVAGDTHELQNQVALVNKSLVATSITADTHGKTSTNDVIIASLNSEVGGCIQEDLSNKSLVDVPSKIKKKKKRHSSQKNELTLENGINCSDQQPDERICTSSIVAEVKVDNYSTHQNPEIPNKKRRSGQGKKLTLESGEPKALAGQNLNEEKSNMSDGKISTSLLTAKVSHKEKSDLLDGSTAQVITQVSDKVAWDTCELQNQDALVNMSSVATSRIADTHEEVNMVHSDIKRKRRPDQGKKLALEGEASKDLVNSSLNQNLKEEKSNLSDEKISTSLVAAKVSHEAGADTCELQNQDPSVNKNSEAALRTAAEHGEVHMVQSEIKKKSRSHAKKLALASGENKLPNTLVNDHSDQSLVEEKLNLLDGKLSTAQLAAEVSHKVDCDTCELQNHDVPVNKNSEAAYRKVGKHEEVNMVQSEVKKKTVTDRVKKHMSQSERNLLSNTLVGNHKNQHLIAEKLDISDEKTTSKSPIIGSEANHKVDNTTLCEVQDRVVGVSKGLDAASQILNTQEEACETRKKRKREKKHIIEKMEIGDVRSEDIGIGTFINDGPPERSFASPERTNIRESPTKRKEKKHEKKKMKSTVPQANASDVEVVVPSSLLKSSVKEAASSIGGVRSDDVMIETRIIDDKLLKSPASPERAHTRQSLKKLLILDLNGLLVDLVRDLPKGRKADTWVSGKALLKRPFCDDFLKFCFETFNVAVWSSRQKKNVETVVDFVMHGKKHKLLFCWDQSYCTKTGFNTLEDKEKPIMLKELGKVWNKVKPDLPWGRGEYNKSNTVLLDDSPYKALLNPPYTAIFPDSYDCTNVEDNALGPDGSLRKYLESLATADNVQKYILENPFGKHAITSKSPSWKYYVNVMRANRLHMPVWSPNLST